MDAAAAEADVKLYKASAELLAELQAKLPLLLRRPNGEARKWVLYAKTTELARLVSLHLRSAKPQTGHGC